MMGEITEVSTYLSLRYANLKYNKYIGEIFGTQTSVRHK